MATYGPDSYIGRVAAVMLGSTETTFYTLSVYFGAAGISRSRYVVVPQEPRRRLKKYEELLPHFLETKALAFSSDYTAVEAINYFTDRGIRIPDQISITGFDDNFYAQIVRPKLTTIHQDVHQKAVLALRKLLLMAEGKEPAKKNVKSPVWLVKRDSVKE